VTDGPACTTLCWQVSDTAPAPPSAPRFAVTVTGLPCLPGPALSCPTSTTTAVPPSQSTVPLHDDTRVHRLPNAPPRIGPR
jgi:hypothetical protein